MKIRFYRLQSLWFFIVLGMLIMGGCARYSRDVNPLYEPSATILGGSGEIYVVIPENQQTQSPNIKWVFGKVVDNDNNQIDEVYSPRSAAETVQAAFGREFKKAGYTVIATAKRPAAAQKVIYLTKTEVDLEQTSALVDIKAKCRMLVGMDVLMDGKLIKRLQYEATSSKSDIRDRDMLAEGVLQDALQSIILKSVPELQGLLGR